MGCEVLDREHPERRDDRRNRFRQRVGPDLVALLVASREQETDRLDERHGHVGRRAVAGF